MKGLSTKQREVLDLIDGYIQTHGYPPSVRDICSSMNLASAAGVHKHISALVQKGYLSKDDGRSRSIQIIRKANTSPKSRHRNVPAEFPLAGYVAAGKPIEHIAQSGEILTLPFSGSEHGCFALQVRGDSMIGENIQEGDYVIVEPRATARDGEAVIALINGGETTLKRYYSEKGGMVRLQPSNPAQEPIIVPGEGVTIQGVVIGIWRQL